MSKEPTQDGKVTLKLTEWELGILKPRRLFGSQFEALTEHSAPNVQVRR
jgi:hypothetical protein